MQHDLSPEQLQQISEALIAGRKIEAIKVYRTATGSGLKEAKEGVEALSGQWLTEDPEKYQALVSTGSGGCASMILCCGSLGWGVVELLKSVG
ncbi:ribosomal protein L7/L12 [Kiritimatiellota bacterium B12222]|nr:ribosomal protein L7/L12 [Kiritimatiellota bacterium B12222]